ncbi:hypothetical protein Vadar_026544 [Vaccinium darrowii]|uniref:Uncharacterized protein n=1 Tax=Vaccinium darrowii TaxID=229202 RepID=A0ACB7YQ16_9ERIC|nr:hypothetical protein Vadar_026544 [Vaccinium darrowii]
MDLVASCKKKLSHFQLKELKDVLTQLGVSKQGKKQDLMDRILDLLSDEASMIRGLAKKKFIGRERVADVIDHAYRKLQCAAANSTSTNGENSLEINVVKPKEEVVDPLYSEKKIRCPCGSSLSTEYMIQCADPQCLVFQHICCVIIQEEYSEGIPPIPTRFYCEICRIHRADPFWVTVEHLLSPVKLITTNNAADGTNPLQNVKRTFQLTRAEMALLENNEYDVQAWCILLNDEVPFRMQWPLFADLKVNGIPVRTVKRPGSQQLGANGRDDGPMIAVYLSGNIDQISLSGCDPRSFCLGVRLVKRRTIQQILSMILEEKNGEPFEDALARVRCCIRGGMVTENGDSDSDLEVIADIFTVSLRCPMSGCRIKTAGRFKPCAHMGCFDLQTFVQLNQHSKKWQCPICLKNYSLDDITVDPYFDRIAKMVQDCREDVTEIDVKPDGSWRVKSGYQFKHLEQWHLPDGSICVSRSEVSETLEASRHLNEEGNARHINANNSRSPRDMQSTCRNQLGEHFGNDSHNVIIMSSSSSESCRDDGDCSVKKDCTINSNPCNMDTTDKNMSRDTDAWLGNFGIIVISDSEEDSANLTCPDTLRVTQPVNYGGHSFPAPPTCLNAALDAGVSSSLGLSSSESCRDDGDCSGHSFPATPTCLNAALDAGVSSSLGLSSSESCRDDGDCSVNKDCTINSNPCNMDTTDKNMSRDTKNMSRDTDAWLGDIGIIVISDSEEDSANLTCPDTLRVTQPVNYGGHSFPAPPTCLNAALDAGVSSSLGLFNNIGNGFEKSHPAALGSQLQPFQTDNISDTAIDLDYTPVTFSAPIDDHPLTSKCSTDSDARVFGSSNTKAIDSMESSDIGGGNLTSLGLGHGGGDAVAGIHVEPTTSNGLDLVNQLDSNEALLPPSVHDEIRCMQGVVGTMYSLLVV